MLKKAQKGVKMKRLTAYILILTLLMLGMASASNTGLVYHEVQVVDEVGKKVTDISSVEIYAPDTTTDATIYMDAALQNAITLPMTTSSTNTTLSNGYFCWWGADGWDFSITDGTNISTNANHRTRSSSEGTLVFPSYLTSITTSQYLDAESITMGTSSDWVINAGTTDDLLTFTPATDGAVFRIGLSAGTKSADFQVYTASGVGLLIDEGANTLGITGLTTSINASSNYDTNINTGTSTGAVTIGSSTSGALVIDTTSTIGVTADDSYTLGVTAGTVGIAATGGDITIDATDKSVIIRGTEEASDAVLITADGTAGGVHIDSGTGDITLDSGDDIFLEANTGTGDVISIINTKGTSTSAIVGTATVGGIDLDSALSTHITSSEETGDAIYIHASGTAGGVDITSGTGDIVLTSTDDIVLTNATAAGDMIQLLNTAGTSVTEDSGAIQITATAGAVIIQSDADLDDCIQIRADGGTTSEILIHNDQGSAADAIQILADAGGITLTADGASAGDILIDAEDDIQLTTTGKLTITNTEAMTVSGAATIAGATTTGAFIIVDQVVTDTASVTLTAAMSGKVLVIANLGQDTTIDLPAEVDGLNFEFWYVGSAVETHDHIIDAEANANFFIGGVQWFDSDDNTMTEVYSNGSTNSKITLHNMQAGTRIKITCDGTNWYIVGTVYSDTTPAFAASV